MTADEPMSTPDSGGLRVAVEGLAADLDEAVSDGSWLSEGETSEAHRVAHLLRALLAAQPEPVPTPDGEGEVEDGVFGSQDIANALGGRGPDSADDATVGEREVCDHASKTLLDAEKGWTCYDCGDFLGYPATPPADDANRAPVSGGLDEGEREATEYAIVNDWLVEVVNEHTCGTGSGGHYGAHEPGCGMVPVANIAAALKAERDTARREADERIAVAIEAKIAHIHRNSYDSDVCDDGCGWLTFAARIARADALTSDDGSGA